MQLLNSAVLRSDPYGGGVRCQFFGCCVNSVRAVADMLLGRHRRGTIDAVAMPRWLSRWRIGMARQRRTRKSEAGPAVAAKAATAQAGGPRYASEAQNEGDPAASPEWALWQSAEPLWQAVLASAALTNAALDARATSGLVDVPRDLLRPLDALPRPLTLDEVKARSGSANAHATQAE
jgi:hypothetical protein